MFPRYYLWGVISCAVALPSLICGTLSFPELRGPTVAVQAGLIVSGLLITLYSGNTLTPAINAARDGGPSTSQKFERLHRRSVILNALVLMIGLGLLVAFAIRKAPTTSGIKEPAPGRDDQRSALTEPSRSPTLPRAHRRFRGPSVATTTQEVRPMIRRCVIAIAVAAIVSVGGCGRMMLVQYGEPVWLIHRVNRTFPQPSHRVALATYEVLKAELAKVGMVDEELTQDDRFEKPDGKTPAPGEIQIPDDVPAFWMNGLSSGPIIVKLRYLELAGKDRDGRVVQAVVRIGVETPEPDSVVSIQIGDKGDAKASGALLDKIAERLAHPTHKPGSLEERQALQTLFLSKPGEADGKTKASREFRIRKD